MPFSKTEFFAVFTAYNAAIWPVQLAAILLGSISFLLVWRRPGKARMVVLFSLAAMWAWTGAVYHILYFSRINPIATAFGAGFILQALFLIFFALKTSAFDPLSSSRFRWLGAMLGMFAGVVYPVIGALNGHAPPAAPAFGVTPCPLAIFTLQKTWRCL